jgi:ABC-type multidrug transport system fused ATPase/permease subunit
VTDEALSAALVRYVTDPQFAARVQQNDQSALADSQLVLDAADTARFLRLASDLNSSGALQQVAFSNATAQRAIDMQNYTLKLFKDTLGNAAKTYTGISRMNKVMFWVGAILFVASAIYGAITENVAITLFFGGLSATSVVAVFLRAPLERMQSALSNLIQAEVGFMNYFEQITLWETVGLALKGNPPMIDPENVAYASRMLQTRTSQTMGLLERYLESDAEGLNRQTLPEETQEAAYRYPDPAGHGDHDSGREHGQHDHPHQPDTEHGEREAGGNEREAGGHEREAGGHEREAGGHRPTPDDRER